MQLPTQEVDEILNREEIKPGLLTLQCPLDYGLHGMITPSENLGNLDNIPLEIQHAIIGYLDVNSLLVLRRVSCKAISVVDSMLEWQKVMKHAPHTIRMAIGLGTSSTFTIIDLCHVLHEKNCFWCGQTGAYIDMFALKRRCLKLNHYQPNDSIFRFELDLSIRNLTSAGRASIPSIKDISTRFVGPNGVTRLRFYALPMSQLEIMSAATEISMHPNTLFLFGENTPRQCITSIFAPWLSPNSMEAETGVSCRLCEKRIHTARLFNLYLGTSSSRNRTTGHLSTTGKLYTTDELKEHHENEHRDE